MRTIKIIHSADFHLDSPFEGLSAAKAAVRRSEQRDLLSALVELASAEEADLMLLSGDSERRPSGRRNVISRNR